jgi:hypothetical protein
LRHQRPIHQNKVGTIINMIRINFFILTNHSPAVEKQNNGLNGRPFKLSENIFIAGLIKINLFTSYGHAYLIIEVRFKIGNS